MPPFGAGAACSGQATGGALNGSFRRTGAAGRLRPGPVMQGEAHPAWLLYRVLTAGSLAGAGGVRGFGQPGVQPVPDFGGSVGAAAPLVADDHDPGGGYPCESGQS